MPKNRNRSGRFLVVLEPESDPHFRGYFNAYVPALPGCVSYGKGRRETLGNVREAIEGYLEALKKERLPIPRETGTIEEISGAA